MEFLTHILEKIEPVQYVYGMVAIFGGVARYLNSFSGGTPFNMKVLAASTFVSGFSGWMFATMGTSMNLPQPFIFMMAGTGGFFGDQTMKFVFEYLQKKVDR